MSIAIKVENLSKCYHIYDNPSDRLKQFAAPRLQRLFGKRPSNTSANSGRLKTFRLRLKKAKPLASPDAMAAVNLRCCKLSAARLT